MTYIYSRYQDCRIRHWVLHFLAGLHRLLQIPPWRSHATFACRHRALCVEVSGEKFACCIVVLIALNRFSGFTLLFFLLFTAFYIWQIVTYILGVLRLVDMYNFYTHLLRIPDVSYLPAGLAKHSNFPIFLGGHSNDIMAGNHSSYWCHSRRKSHHCDILKAHAKVK